MSLCPYHREQWMTCLDLKATWQPAMVQIGGQSEANLVRHVLDSRKARTERWRDTVRHTQAIVRANCERGIGCTITDPFQPNREQCPPQPQEGT